MTAKLRSTLYLVIALLVLVTAAQAMAQSNTAIQTENELTGVVTAITPTTITIGTMTFDIAQAEVQATIAPGDVVKVHYTVATDGTLVAREIQFAVDVTPESTMEATESPEAEGTPEATEAFDDHGQDNPATHVEDQQNGQSDSHHGQGNITVQNTTPTVDDHGQDNANTHQQDQNTPQPAQNNNNDDGGHHDGGGDHGGNSGHGG